MPTLLNTAGSISSQARCRDQTRQPTFRVNLASVPLVCSFRRAEIAPGPQDTPRDRTAHRCTPPSLRSIPAAKFRHSGELNGATKAPLNSPLNDELRTQRRSRRKTPSVSDW
jgi:hypothetical protein